MKAPAHMTPIRVALTTGTKSLSQNSYTYVREVFEVTPIGFKRRSMGRGAASKRYSYHVIFVAPEGVIDVHSKSVAGLERTEWVQRRANPGWKPPKDGWVDDVWWPAGERMP